MVVTNVIEGTIGTGPAAVWFHYDVTADILNLRHASERTAATTAEETPDGLLLLRREVDHMPVGLTIINWWKRFGAKSLPDSLKELGEAIEPWSRKIAACNTSRSQALTESAGDGMETTLSSSLRKLLIDHPVLLLAFINWATKSRWPVTRSAQLHSSSNEERVVDNLGAPRRIDMQIRYRDDCGKLRTIRSEHKLRAMTDPNQLACYRALTDLPAEDVCLCFLTPYPDDASVAAFHCDRSGTWAELAHELTTAEPDNPLLKSWVKAVILQAPGSARRKLNTQTVQAVREAVQRMDSDQRIYEPLPRMLSETRRIIPPHWDRSAVYFGLSPTAFSDDNCRCIYFGFRYHKHDLGVPIADGREVDLVLAAHAYKNHEPFDLASIERSVQNLNCLPPTYRPSVVSPPTKLRGRWHKLVAIRPISIDLQAMNDPQSLADYALEVWPFWWKAVAHLGEALKQPK